MLSIFAAAPGTFIVERNAALATIKTPVVGYQHIQGSLVFPLCAKVMPGLSLGRALMTPDGFVTDAAASLVCASLAEWEALVDSPGYRKIKPHISTVTEAVVSADGSKDIAAILASAGKELGASPTGDVLDSARTARQSGDAAVQNAAKVASLNMESRTAEQIATDAERRMAAAKPANGAIIPDKRRRARKPRIFSTTSYWMFGADDNALRRRIWIIPAGEVVPFEDDPDYTKIKGEEFKAMKAEDWTVGDPRLEEAKLAENAMLGPDEPASEEEDGSALI